MTRKFGFFIFAFFILLLAVAGCGKGGDSSSGGAGGPPVEDTPGGNLPSTKISRIEITPGAFLLTEPGKSVHLSAQAYDADGKPIDAAIAWKTSDEAAVTITPEGLAAAVGGVGSAQITAQAEGVSSGPVLALLAQPVGGAILVQDSQVVGIPEAVDPAAPYGLGWRYRATLSGIGLPNPGDILVGTGEVPLGGRVVEAAQNGESVTVTLEVVPLRQMFANLRVKESLDLSRADFEVSDEIAARYDVRREPDGRITFTPRPAVEPVQPKGAFPEGRRSAPSAAVGTSALGPFSCDDSEVTDLLGLEVEPVFALSANLNVEIGYDSATGGFQKLLLTGEPTVQAAFKPQIKAALGGEISCKVTLTQIPLPGGPLALVFGAKVPIGVGFKIAGEVSAPLVSFEWEKKYTAAYTVGVQCTVTCGMVAEMENKNEEKPPKWSWPDTALDQLNMSLGVHAYAFATVDVGNPFLQFLQFEALKAKFGIKHDLELKPMTAQATDAAGASSFALSLEASAGAGEGVQVIKDLLEIEFLTLELTWDQALAHSPQGSLAITPAAVKAGDDTQLGEMAIFTVTLDSSTFLGIEAVEGVEIKWLKNGSLEPGRPGCASLTATPGQTAFTCQTDFLQEHLGEQTFYAFVKASLFGVPLPIPLEVADDSKAKVTVEGQPNVRVSRTSSLGGDKGNGQLCEGIRHTSLAPFSFSGSLPDCPWAHVSQDSSFSFDTGGDLLKVTATGTASASESPGLVVNYFIVHFDVLEPVAVSVVASLTAQGGPGSSISQINLMSLTTVGDPIICVAFFGGDVCPASIDTSVDLNPGRYVLEAQVRDSKSVTAVRSQTFNLTMDFSPTGP